MTQNQAKKYLVYGALAVSLAINGVSVISKDKVEEPHQLTTQHETDETPVQATPSTYIVQGFFKVMYPVVYERQGAVPTVPARVGVLESVTQEHRSVAKPVPDSVKWNLPFLNELLGVSREHIQLVGFDARKISK